MKKIFNKTILPLIFLIIFLIIPSSKVSAELAIKTSTGPVDNTITPNDGVNSVQFTVTFQVLCKDPTAVDNIWFQPYIDGVKQPSDAVYGARYIWSGKAKDYCNQTLKKTFVDGVKYPSNSKVYSWKLTDATGQIIYVNKSFTYKTYTGDEGFYYIFKQQSGSTSSPVYVFEYSSKFKDLTSCTTDSKNLSTRDTKSILYKECQEYNYLPDLTTEEFENISLQQNSGTGSGNWVYTDSVSGKNSEHFDSKDICEKYRTDNSLTSSTTNCFSVYTLLAPIGSLKEAPNNIGDYFNIIFKIAIGLCAVLAVVMIVISGIQYMGDESIFSKTEAKSKITAAVLGLLIALGSYALLNTINPALLGGGGVNISQVSAEIQDETETAPWEGTSSGDNSILCPEGYTNVATSGTPSSINVCKSISSNLTKLLAAAKASNIILSGSGSRTKAEQQTLRAKNGCTDASLSSSKCTPPTAQPGHSMHESGMAVDFKCNGKTMMASGGKNSVCFIWLQANAGTNGFKNLASEPWHWSAGAKAGH